MSIAPNDPTRAGPPLPDGRFDDVVFSISEIQAASVKAARGSGMPWGLAEEVGMAAAWLTAAGLPGPELVLAFLEQPMGEPPAIKPGSWHAPREGRLCPIRTGAALCDFAQQPGGLRDGKLVVADLAFPLLAVPFVAHLARRSGLTITVQWPGFEAVTAPDGHWVSVSKQGAELATCATVTFAPGGSAPALPRLGSDGRRVPLEVWRRLDALGMRTTVPATTRSHADAGAAASDND